MIDNEFFIEDNKMYKVVEGQKRLIVLLKPGYLSITIEIDGVEFDMENTNNLLNANIIKYVIEKANCTLENIDIEPHIIRQIVDGLDLYAIDISKIWDFQIYDSWIDIIYYRGIDKETNQLIY